ncbi:hypothetical protein CHUAL_013388 [Chamberlinius hualienensis]
MLFYQLLLWVLAITVNDVWCDDQPSSFLAIQIETTNEIPSECQDLFKVAGQAISNIDVDWDVLCSGHILDNCKSVLKYTFLLEFAEDEIEDLYNLIKAFTVTGADYICGRNRTTIQGAMDDGGSDCLSASNIALGYCSYVSILKFVTDNDPESLCSTMDYSYNCAMDAISQCDATKLKDLWSDYFTTIMRSSMCIRYPRYRYNTTTQITSNFLCLIFAFVFFLEIYFVNIS